MLATLIHRYLSLLNFAVICVAGVELVSSNLNNSLITKLNVLICT